MAFEPVNEPNAGRVRSQCSGWVVLVGSAMKAGKRARWPVRSRSTMAGWRWPARVMGAAHGAGCDGSGG